MDSYFGFLTQTGQIFSKSAGTDSAIESAVRLAVPRLGDWCAVQLMDEYRNIRSAIVARMIGGGNGGIHVTHTTFRRGPFTGTPKVTPLDEFPAESALVLPLTAQGRILGILTLGMAGPGGFSGIQSQLAEEFAQCISLGLEGVRLRNPAGTPSQLPPARAATKRSSEDSPFGGDGMTRAIADSLAEFAAAASGHDVSGFKSALASLAAEEERYRLALEVGRIGVWDYDVRADRFIWSERLCEIHGLLPDQAPVTYEEFLQGVHPQDRLLVARLHRNALRETGHFEAEYRILRPSGEIRWRQSAGGVLRDASGQPVRFIGASIDVTDRKQAEEAARHEKEKAQQENKIETIGRLAGSVAHDFNNLLMTINGYAELILASEKDIGEIRRYAWEIRSSGDRAEEITKQLLAFGRRQLLRPVVTDLNDLVASMKDLLENLVSGCAELNSTLDPRLDRVLVDPGQIKQVILHLVMNSRDAMPMGGVITIATRSDFLEAPMDSLEVQISPGRYAVLEIADMRAEIDSGDLERIFDPFFTTKPLGVKAGLGLSMVQGIIRQSGGFIQVESLRDSGTRFKVYIPAISPAKLATA